VVPPSAIVEPDIANMEETTPAPAIIPALVNCAVLVLLVIVFHF